jgi:serine-type D-Ala-D-Ala carboxypeptidase (penicillin-binding protein 5/6)
VSQHSPVPLMVAPFRLDSLREDEPPPPPEPPGRGRRRRAHRRHSRLLVVLVVLVLLVAAAGAFTSIRLRTADPAPTVHSVLTTSVHVPTLPVAMPWPQTGQGAVAVPALGIDVDSGAQTPVPVASLTKLMTAYVILQDHPVALGLPGPNVTVTQDDVNDYNFDTITDQSNAQVSVGEVLSEEQLLAGMLVHSADDYADILARWDAGTAAAFVAKMNATAAQLGMAHSHFVDASGISPESQSTAGDILKVAALDMDSALVRALVRMPDVTLPMTGTIRSYTPLLGLQGILGVKSGVTNAAGGCDVVAVERTVHGHTVRILAAVTGQTGPNVLVVAGLHGLALVNAVTPLIGATTVVSDGQLVAHVRSDGQNVDARATSSASVLTWPGMTAQRVFVAESDLTDQARRGARVGTVVVQVGAQRVAVPVRLRANLSRPSLFQRLF